MANLRNNYLTPRYIVSNTADLHHILIRCPQIFQIDGDGSGSIDFDEFLELIAGKMKSFGENEAAIRRAFRTLDKDMNGYITVKELREVMSRLGETLTHKEVTELVNEADTNGDGRIDIDEFVIMMMQN